MTAAEQQLAFEQAKARIEKNIAEIAALSLDASTPPPAFFRRYLDLTLASLDARGGAIWAIEQGQIQRVAEVSFDTSGYNLHRQKGWIEAVISQTVSSKAGCAVAVNDVVYSGGEPPAGGIGNEVPHPFFYIPVLLDGETRLVIQVWLKQAGDPRTYADISAFLGQLAAHAATYLRGMQRRNLSERYDQAQTMLRMQAEFLGELDPKVLHSVAANFLVDLLHCDAACVFQKKGSRWVLAAASNQEVVDARAVHSRALAGVADRLVESPEGNLLSLTDAGEDLAPALNEAGLKAVTWCHLKSSKNARYDRLLIGVRHSTETGPAGERAVIVWCAGQLARALDSATHFHHIPLRPLASAGGRAIRAWRQSRHGKVLVLLVLPLVLLVAGLSVPVPWKLTTECAVVPRRTTAVVAEASGKVTEVAVREGQIVQKGDLLGRIEDADQVTQIAVARQQLMRWQVEAGKAQAMNNEPERKIAELGAMRETEAIRRHEYLRSRTELRAPLDGVVLTRSLHNREGEALEVGKAFCEIGSLGEFDLQLDLKQKDLGLILGALQAGRKLPVEFILHPHPDVTLSAEIVDPRTISQVPEPRKQETVFIARIPFPSGSSIEDALKPGYTGKAKILMGRKPLAFILSRPFLHYWKTHWGI